jgi:hypothetical protein
MIMPRPPNTPPHSDTDGVHEDEVRNVDAAIESGQGTKELARARSEAAAKPDFSSDDDNAEDRSR